MARARRNQKIIGEFRLHPFDVAGKHSRYAIHRVGPPAWIGIHLCNERCIVSGETDFSADLRHLCLDFLHALMAARVYLLRRQIERRMQFDELRIHFTAPWILADSYFVRRSGFIVC